MIGIGLFAMAVSVQADNHEEKEKTYLYATYANCDVTGEDAADATFDKYMAPEYKNALEQGEIKGWGYLKHHTGGSWRRLTYHMSGSVLDSLKAIEKMGDRMDGKLTPRNNDYGRACHTHDDYIWELKFGTAREQRGKVGMSVYFVCDMNGESRADELVEKEFAAIYDAHLGPGKLTSWAWMTHVVGGKYRRLLSTTAENLDDLLNTRAELLRSFGGSSAGREFSSICGSHSDYIWNIAMEGR